MWCWLGHGAQKVIAEEEVLQILVQINKNLEEMKKCNSKKDARLKLEKEIAKLAETESKLAYDMKTADDNASKFAKDLKSHIEECLKRNTSNLSDEIKSKRNLRSC